MPDGVCVCAPVCNAIVTCARLYSNSAPPANAIAVAVDVVVVGDAVQCTSKS